MTKNQKNNSKKPAELELNGPEAAVKLHIPATMNNSGQYDAFLDKIDISGGIRKIVIDCSDINHYDSYFVLLISSFNKIAAKSDAEVELTGTTNEMDRFLKIFTPPGDEEEEKRAGRRVYEYFSKVGKRTTQTLKDSKNFIEFIGDMVVKSFSLFLHPSKFRWNDFTFYFLRGGVNALPIVILIVFLIGVITGYQGALQLKQFGADIYIADLIGISITRELSPLMTAILVAGRSGSAFASEIGTMKVSEEVDALNSMGFDHVTFLVLPRIFAVMLAMPLLTIIANVAGIGGGLIAAVSTLEVTVTGYVNQLNIALNYAHVFTGIGKSIIFGLLVATVGCFRGLQVSGGAESVGKFTTSAVVSGVFLIILTDAVFTFLFQALGI